MCLRCSENRQRAKQYRESRVENNSLVTLLSSIYAKTDSLVPSFKMEGEPAIDAHHHSFNITRRTAIPTRDVNKAVSGYRL